MPREEEQVRHGLLPCALYHNAHLLLRVLLRCSARLDITSLQHVYVTADKAMMSMADPLVDVRIATWLVMPDAIEVTDSPTRVSMRKGDNPWNLEGLLNLRAGKEAVTSSVAVLRKVSGNVGKVHTSLWGSTMSHIAAVACSKPLTVVQANKIIFIKSCQVGTTCPVSAT